MTKRLLLLVFALALALTAAPAVSASATTTTAARTHTCVDNYEWNNFYIGSGKSYTERLFDTRGWTVWRSGGTWVKKYNHCGWRYDIVRIKYEYTGFRWVVAKAVRF